MKLAKSIYLSKGCVLYDDLAQPMMTMIEDTVGRHDTLAGNCSREINMVRYGATAPLSCRDNFIKALGELGMGPRDIPANINFFMNVPVSADGQVAIVDGISKPGDYVDLRCEKDVIVVISNCPQEHNPCSGGSPTPIRLTIWQPAEMPQKIKTVVAPGISIAETATRPMGAVMTNLMEGISAVRGSIALSFQSTRTQPTVRTALPAIPSS